MEDKRRNYLLKSRYWKLKTPLIENRTDVLRTATMVVMVWFMFHSLCIRMVDIPALILLLILSHFLGKAEKNETE